MTKAASRRTLYTFQKLALSGIYASQRIALFFQMRLGKTLIVLRRLRRHTGPFLISAPNDALISWQGELQREDESFVLVTGTAKKRREALCKPARYYLINKEGFTSIPKELAAKEWEAIVLDESTFIKNPKAKVTKYFSRNFKNTPIKIILTGTPAPESKLNYIPQLLFLEPRWLGVKTFWEFRAKFCRPYGFDWVLHKQGQTRLNLALQNCHFLTREQVGLDRVKIFTRRSVHLPPAFRKVYNTIIKEFMLEYQNIQLDTKTAAQAFTWLRHLATGIIQDQLVFKGKLDVILDLLAGELKGQPVIIWTNMVAENTTITSALIKRYKVASISGATSTKKRRKLIAEFDAGVLDYLVIQIQCATYGLNLSHASVAIYNSCPYGYLQRKQSEDRILTTQGKGPLLYIDIVTEDTIDLDVLEGIAAKQSAQTVQSNIIRRISDAHNRQNHADPAGNG